MQGRAREVRGFSPTAYFSGATGLLPGVSTGFTASVLLRCLGPSTQPVEHIFGNYNNVTLQGWRVHRQADPNPFEISYGVEVWAGGVLYTANLSGLPGATFGAKVTPIHVRLDETGLLTFYAFGFLLAGAQLLAPYDPCAETTSIGYDVNVPNNFAERTAVMGCAYAPRVLTIDEIAVNMLEMIKRGDITSGGLSTPWEYEYSFLQDCGMGVCSTLKNRQGAFGALAATGRTELINGAPRLVYGF